MELVRRFAEKVVGAVLDAAPWMTARQASERHLSAFLSVFARRYGLRLVEIDLPPKSPLARSASSVRLRVDAVILPALLRSGSWQWEEIEVIQRHVDPARRYVLVDIGANVGLVTRQALINIPAIVGARCFEPDPVNFSCLAHNLAPFQNVSLHNVALSDQKGTMEFFLDQTNSGNFSLVHSAMADHAFDRTTVQTENASQAFDDLVASLGPDQRLIYKCDTQGFDERIATLARTGFWDRVDIVVMELSRIKKPDFDIERLRAFLGAFPHRQLGKRQGDLSVDAVVEFASGPLDNDYDDLVMWR